MDLLVRSTIAIADCAQVKQRAAVVHRVERNGRHVQAFQASAADQEQVLPRGARRHLSLWSVMCADEGRDVGLFLLNVELEGAVEGECDTSVDDRGVVPLLNPRIEKLVSQLFQLALLLALEWVVGGRSVLLRVLVIFGA